MRVPKSLMLFPLCILLVGCGGGQTATVSYDSSANRTTYRMQSYTVSSISGNDFASSKEITMRAIARCEGTKCTPDQVQLVFSAAGNQELSLSGVNGRIVTNETQITWTTAEANEALGGVAENQVLKVNGKFAVVDLKLNQLKEIATAESVNGSIGGQSLDIGSGVRSGFQDLLRKIPQG